MSDCSTHAFDVPLKPCPFCGGEARHYAPGPIEHHIECTNPKCYAETQGWTTEAEAIEAWNTRTPIEYDGWFYLPKPKEGITNYCMPELTMTDNGFRVRQTVDVVNEAARKWGDELGEYVMRRICEIWNSRAERTCRNKQKDVGMFECSECGISGITIKSYGLARVEPVRCPNCGAKVVS